ncbi:MAG: hypothetical protein R8P61_15440 [Bacteroidia bacterium]|nr:hypothetical protein [Bacteroidia bacterium]
MKQRPLQNSFWTHAKYLVPFLVPLLTFFLVKILDGRYQYLTESTIVVFWLTAMVFMILWCLKFTKPMRKFSLLLLGAFLISLAPGFFIFLGIIDSNFYSDLPPAKGPYVWYHSLTSIMIFGIYLLRFFSKPEKDLFAILKLSLIIYLCVLVNAFSFFNEDEALMVFISISGIASIILLPLIHGIEMMMWERSKSVWMSYLKEAEFGGKLTHSEG